MKSLWSNEEASGYAGELGLRVYTSRLLGREKSLVLHGGGNTSVKVAEPDLYGDTEDVLYVKGSGSDLERIEASGFSPVRLAVAKRLAQLATLSDAQMMNELRVHMRRADAPTPSVETILHALLPYRYVDHTHADAVLAITNTAAGAERIREIYGADVVILPYVMPGFLLARQCAEEFPRLAHAGTLGMVLLNHGVFTFGASAKESYERMISLVTRAEEYLMAHGAWTVPVSASASATEAPRRGEIAALRRDVSRAAGAPMILASHRDERAAAFVERADLPAVSQQGPATPDHVIRTKRVPLIGRDVNAYANTYREYFEQHARERGEALEMLDPAPRVILDRELGVCTAGRSAKDADTAYDIYAQTITVISRATALGGYRALPARDLFDVEYWELEQAKIRRKGSPPDFQGEVAFITGTASGIGEACVQSFARRGAAVAGIDVAGSAAGAPPGFLDLAGDITDAEHVERAVERTVRRFGGIDMAVLNAGVFPAACRIERLSDADWRRVFEINVDANIRLLRLLHPILRESPKGARVVIVGSKNVRAPGPGAAAYSAAKAALTQLGRVAALEWGADNIKVNFVHPDAVFDTGIWTPEVLQSRAASYGMTVDEYKRRNLLATEVGKSEVGELIAELCGPRFAKTTGAQIPIDGGNERVI